MKSFTKTNIKALKLSLITLGLLAAGLSNIVMAQEQDVSSQLEVKKKDNSGDVEESKIEKIEVTCKGSVAMRKGVTARHDRVVVSHCTNFANLVFQW